MKKKHILIIGYFGFETNQLDGQTVKTRSVYSLIQENINFETESVGYFDTQTFKKTKASLFKLLSAISKANIIFYLPAHGNLTYIFPIVYSISKLTQTKINYLVVGGWLVNFIKNKPLHKYMLSRIEGIYVETNTLRDGLQYYGFKNVHKLYNFRMNNFPILEPSSTVETKQELKLVFLARVHPLKGVELLFKLDEKLKRENITNVYIHIYGPILDSYKEEFIKKIEKSSIHYCGVVQPEDIYKVLVPYDLLLFPTKFYTEGFPGTVLDAYISGLPVVATKWLNAEEFIEDGKTGFITPFDEDIAFINKIIEISQNLECINRLKKNVQKKRYDYSSDRAWLILNNAMLD